MPSDAFFRMALSGLEPVGQPLFNLSTGPFSPSTPTAFTVAYGLLYLVACLTAAAVLFQRKDI